MFVLVLYEATRKYLSRPFKSWEKIKIELKQNKHLTSGSNLPKFHVLYPEPWHTDSQSKRHINKAAQSEPPHTQTEISQKDILPHNS